MSELKPCPFCGNDRDGESEGQMSELYGMTYGGHGAHWDGCENVHWDCRIVRLERRITELEALSLEKSIVMHNQEQRISELEAERRWIPVSERLPKEGKEVLVFISYPEMPESEMASSYEMGFLHTNCFYEAQEGGYKLKYVTHWMPLPEPPETE